MSRKFICLIFIVYAFSCTAQPLQYPQARKTDQTDNYFGTEVKDPYRWLEDDQSAETKQWVASENALTQDYLSKIPFRDSMKAVMKKYWNFPRYETPIHSGNSYFYYRSDGVQNQPMLFYMRGINYVPISYFDPNKLSADGTIAISQTVPSNDGLHLAFVLSKAGSDKNEIRIKQSKSMKTLSEVLINIKFSSVAWWKDGFFYSRYDESGEHSGQDKNHKLYYHHLNTEQSADSLVYEDKEHPLRNWSGYVTPDEHFLVISGSESTSGNLFYIQDLTKAGSRPVSIVKTFDSDYQPIGNIGGSVLFYTNYKAPKYKVIAVNPAQPAPSAWKDIIPQGEDILQHAVIALNKIVTSYMKDARSKLMIYQLDGKLIGEVPLTGFGTVDHLSGSVRDTNCFVSYNTFTSPPVIYRYNVVNGRLYDQFKTPLTALPYNPDDFVTEQVFYTSKDGTKIPMFLVHRKDLKPDGKTPTLVYAYGGFNISKTPEFKQERIIFLEKGGLIALPNLRGGGEYGSAWHEAGTKAKKQNVFDDCIAAAEYLIAKGYTNPSKLAIQGRSNGGLLAGAMITQRPDLFKVALPAVGVMDMLRFHKFTIGWAWSSDYGNSDDSTGFKTLYAYSPLHNIKDGVSYPATFITTADHDDRVIPGHSFKFTATLQEKQKGSNPVLIRVDTDAGHGAGKPTGKLIDEQADIFSFLFYNLGMTL